MLPKRRQARIRCSVGASVSASRAAAHASRLTRSSSLPLSRSNRAKSYSISALAAVRRACAWRLACPSAASSDWNCSPIWRF